VLRVWAGTLRVRRREPDPVTELLGGGGGVVACWHGELLPLMLAYRGRGIVVLVSHSRDGARLAAVLAALGYRTVRGSTSRGAHAAARTLLGVLEEGATVALAVDGPRGPRHSVAPGAERLAALAKCPVLAVRATGSGLRLPTWDRAWLPWPGAVVTVRAQRPGREDSLAAVLHRAAADGTGA
jgi:lysophospholipid acyltransferase (LPLAT)-like uncharacterized protein